MVRKRTSSKRGTVVKPEAHSVVEFKNSPKEGEHVDRVKLICPLQSGPKVNLDWTLKETEHGQEARA